MYSKSGRIVSFEHSMVLVHGLDSRRQTAKYCVIALDGSAFQDRVVSLFRTGDRRWLGTGNERIFLSSSKSDLYGGVRGVKMNAWDAARTLAEYLIFHRWSRKVG